MILTTIKHRREQGELGGGEREIVRPQTEPCGELARMLDYN